MNNSEPEPGRPAAPPIDRHAQAKRFYELLGGGTREVRGIGGKGLLVGYFDNADDFAHAVREASEKGYNTYVNLNPLDPARFLPQPLHRSKKACADADIVRLLFILIDGDAERDHPKGGKICTTDAEHEAALAKIEVIRQFLIAEGCPANALIHNDSGNGGALLLRIDLPNVPASVELIRRLLQALAEKFNDPKCHVDTAVGNPSRITRVPGSKNNKLSTKDRPNRLCHTLSASDAIEVAPVDFLNKIAGTAIAPTEEQPDPEIDFAAIPEGDRKEQMAMLLAYLADAGIKPTGLGRNEQKHFTCVNLPYCLLKGAEHQTPGRAGILVYDDGRIGYHCFSAQCVEKGWAAVQTVLGSFTAFCVRRFDKTELQFDDPLRLARKHIAGTAMPDGTATFAHFLNTTHRYTNDEWQELGVGEEDAWVRATIQREHDELARFLTKQTGEVVRPDPVCGGHVRETMAAIQSLCKHRVSKKTQPPFWLSPHNDWRANDVLVFTNGFFNLRHWLEGKEFFIPKTPKLFYRYQAMFDYAPEAGRPAAWHAFLDSLQQRDDWRRQLQQMMGYLLWPGYDLQKFFPVFGPPRAGKGIIIQVAADMGGGACSITLDGFCDSFGLEKAIGQRLILVGETEKGPTKYPVSAVVGAIKAITGGGEVEVNRKHIKNVSLRLPGKIVMQGNSPFALADNSEALMARCIPFRLTTSFVGREDLALPEKLRLEYPGILAWCLEGLRSLYDAGRFTLCESTQSELEQARDLATPLQTFLEDCCAVDATRAVHCKSLYRIFEQWLVEEDAPLTWNDKQFGIELRTAIPVIDRKRLSNRNDTHYNGAQIVKTDFDSDSARPWVYVGIAPKPNRCRVTDDY